jgi:collagen type II alpha
MTEQERRELVVKAYEQLKASFDRFKKPNGDKNDPGKTCKDIWSAYPESKSGKMVTYYWCLKGVITNRD